MENNFNSENRAFKGIWIPAEIYLNKDLNWTEKILFIEIDSLDKTNGCNARNKYFADFLGISERAVSDAISKLKELGLIEQTSFDGKKRTLKIISDWKFTSRQTRSLLLPSKNDTLLYNNINNIYNNNTLVNLPQIDDNVLQKWNDLAKKYSLAEIRSLTPDRKKKFLARLKDQKMTEEQFFNEISIALEDSPFLRGKKWHEIPGHLTDSYWEDSDWRADFDFFLQPSSLQKAIEGKYADPTMRKMRMRNQQKQ